MKWINQIKNQLIALENNTPIRKKFIVVYGCVILLPIFAITMILSREAQNQAMTTSMRQAVNLVEGIDKQLRQKMELALRISDQMYVDAQLKDLLTTRYTNAGDSFDALNKYKKDSEIIEINHDSISKILVTTDNMTILNSRFTQKMRDESWNSDNYRELINGNNGIKWAVWENTERNKKQENDIVLLRKLNLGNSSRGILHIYLNVEALAEMLGGQLYETVITDEEGVIIVAGDKTLVGKSMMEYGIDVKEQKGNEYYDGFYKNKKTRFIMGQRISQQPFGFYIISFFSLDDIYKETVRVRNLGIGIALAAILVGLECVVLVSQLMTRRIEQLSESVNEVALGGRLKCVDIDGNDEIGQLGRDVNKMITNLEKLVREIYIMNEEEKRLISKQKEVEFEMLVNQINPHFVFNTLETIRMKAHCHGEEEIADVIQQFGRLFRRNLNVEKGMVLLKEEIIFLENYLFIQKYRFGDKLDYKIQVEGDISDITILPLLLQPLIENAVVHGIENKEENGSVQLSVQRMEDRILFTVIDDGIGMSKETLQILREELKKEDELKRLHIGVKNVNQRIILYYGKEYQIEIDSEENAGTRMRFSIPV